ncbi:MAG TPA: hypothetical protein VFM46_18305, partial [Pseudomonadales bacterium]|nr:hypothetical protein [Pseudomonadales bacterium]
MARNDQLHTCIVCHKNFTRRAGVDGDMVRSEIAQLLAKDFSNWTASSFVCYGDLARYRAKYVHSILESEKGELSDL